MRFGLKEILCKRGSTSATTYLTVELKLLENRLPEAYEIVSNSLAADPPGEFDFSRIRQLAKVARKMGAPEKALSVIKSWLKQFPDAPDSGVIWLDLCANASAAGGKYLPDAGKAFLNAKELLGDVAALRKLKVSIGSKL